MTEKYELLLYADYNTFFIIDAEDEDDAMAFLPDRERIDMDNRMQMGDNIVAIFTQRRGTSRITIERHDVEPTTNLGEWDHVVEGGLQIPSHKFQVLTMNCTAVHLQVAVNSSEYRLRVHQGGLATVSDPDECYGDDRYLIYLWPAPLCDLIVLKQYTSDF